MWKYKKRSNYHSSNKRLRSSGTSPSPTDRSVKMLIQMGKTLWWVKLIEGVRTQWLEETRGIRMEMFESEERAELSIRWRISAQLPDRSGIRLRRSIR